LSWAHCASATSACSRERANLAPIAVAFALQCALLAMHAPALGIGAAAVLAGFAFSYGTVIWDTALQQTIAPEKLARVSAYNWMGAIAFLPAGYAIAGPVASVIGMSTSLWIGVVWIVVTTLIVISVRDVRDFRLEPIDLPETELALAIAES
jgi:hypothetical protein